MVSGGDKLWSSCGSDDSIVSCFSIVGEATRNEYRLMNGDAIKIAVAIAPRLTIQAIKKIEVKSQRLAIAIDFCVND